MDEGAKERLLKAIPYGLYAIGVRRGDERNAFTANWLTQCSFDPPMLALAVDNEAHSLGLIRESGAFSVNFFASGQRRQAARLARPASRAPDKLHEFEQREGETSAPLLTGLLGYLECRVAGECPAGDHTVLVAAIVAAGLFADDRPLEIHQAGFNYAG